MSWISPFSLPGGWFKGNLHTHTTQSEGLLTPDEAIAWYRQRGYDFVALTDHELFTPGRTFAPANDFVTIAGAEIRHGPGYHMLALGISALPDRKLQDSSQAVADAIRAQGGLAFFAHPYRVGQISADMASITGVAGIEVFNSLAGKEKGKAYSDFLWDELLARGVRLTALAVDDVHWGVHGSGGQGFVMVRASHLDEDSILEAIRKGHFYSSTGPKIADLRIVRLADGQLALRVHCSPCSTITCYASSARGCRFKAPSGEMLDSATWPLRAEQVYVRVECRDAQGRIAWSNPLFVADVLDGEGRGGESVL